VTTFVDANVLVYTFGTHDESKHRVATSLAELWRSGTGAVSTQVLQEEALVVEAALLSGARTLLSEDLQHGRRVGELTVENPFRPGVL